MKKYRALVLAAVSLLIACEHGADAPQEALVQVRIGHSQTRSVLPTAPNLEDMDWFTLYGTASGKDPSDPDYKESWLADFFYEDGVFYDYNNGTEAVVYVRQGTWRFVLYAYPPGGGTAALKGTEMVNITAGFDGTVNFTLSPYTGEESDTGYIFVYIALPEGSDVTAVETTIDGEPLDPPLIVDDDAVIYESDAIPVGQYLFSFTLKDSAEQTVAVISDVVVVSAGAESAKEYMLTDEDLNGPPAPPSDFVIESYDVENQTFRFTWQDNSFNETGFTLSDGTATHPIAATVQSFDLSVPDHSAPVTYALKAVNRFGESVAAQISGPLLFTVTFDADHDQGGEAQERQAYPGGSLGADAPSDPTRAGYTFDGWRTDRDGSGSVFTADTAVVRDMTVYAAWTEGAKYELTQNPGYDEYVCNADDLLPLGFTVEAGDQVTISLSIKTDTLMRNFCLGIADWENIDYYENSEDAWIAPGWEYAKYTVSADREFHSYTWVLTARTDAPAGPAPLVVQLAMDSVNQDKVSIYVKDVSVDKRSDLFAGLTLAESLAWISANAEQDGDYIITVKNNEPLTPQELYYSGRNVSITLQGDTAERIVSLGSNGSLFILGYGVTLTLGNNISLQGRGSNTASLVQVNSGGTLVMNSGSRIAGNTNSSGSGGGVVVDSGTLTMNGGAISGNSSVSNGGGGVFVDNGTLILNDGTIGGNTSGASGGGVFVRNSTFTMTGGTVNGNTSYQTRYGGGGVIVDSGTFTMTGGEISGNTAYNCGGGVYVSAGTFIKQAGGAVYGSDAGSGLRNAARSDSYGHAVYVASGSKRRDTTAGEGVELDSRLSGDAGGWRDGGGGGGSTTPISNITYSSVSGGTWTLQSNDSRRSPTISHGGLTKARVSFTSTTANASITVQLEVSSESGYDYAFVSQLDNSSATSSSGYYSGSRISGTSTVVVTIPVSTPGDHFIDIGYQKDDSASSGSDCAWFTVIP